MPCVGMIAPDMNSNSDIWARYKDYYREFPALGFAADFCRMDFCEDFLNQMSPKIQHALDSMAALEKGAIANPDENRMVGHYWLRTPALAPTKEITREIEDTVASIKRFAADVHAGRICGAGGTFKNVLLIGIGGSALGPQFVSHALGGRQDKLRLFFLDNTDPDGMDRIFASIGEDLGRTLCIVISKSGGTKETRNGMLEAEHQYKRMGLPFEKHATAVTMRASSLDNSAVTWLARFPMWDWVGGRTSLFSAVGLLPAALQGFDIDHLLSGAHQCDEMSRRSEAKDNPALLLALSWYLAGNGKGDRMMVVLPYKDRLELFSKYLQQLVMESLGKEHDLSGKIVNQGLSVLGNKGATDQHSYVQQLRDGVDNYMAAFVEVMRDRTGPSIHVEGGITSGDYLHSFFLGTREALYEKGRKSVTLTIESVCESSVGFLVALFERAVGLYAFMVNINAYHQPGVQAGKVAADDLIKLERSIMDFFKLQGEAFFTVSQIASSLNRTSSSERIFKICKHLASNDLLISASSEGNSHASISFRKP